MADLTPFQTAGPFLSLGLRQGVRADGREPAAGAIAVSGRLTDGGGAGVPDGVLEFWHPAFAEVSRALTSADGSYRIVLDRPAPVEGPDGSVVVVPYLAIRILGRGILTQYLTRMYFPGDPANDSDPVLGLVPAARRATLIAARLGPDAYAFDVVLQGEHETAFFDA